MENRTRKNKLLRHAIATPFIWMMIIPVLFSDILIEIYHRICFPLYGLPYVSRRKYIRIMDRGRLQYLSLPEKLGCMYCGYVNGWLHYASVIAGETEKYWCAIMHKQDGVYVPAAHEETFAPFGDKEEAKKRGYVR